MGIRTGFCTIFCMLSASFIVVSCLRKEFIGGCLYYSTTMWKTNSITYICFDQYRYIESNITFMKCSNYSYSDSYARTGCLHFKNCQFSRIKFDIFAYYYQLYTLNISSIELQYLSEEFFHKANYLSRLFASNNRLTEIVHGQFDYTSELTEVDFSYNKINVIAESAFIGTVSLQKLNLSHNHILKLHRKTFDNSRNLTILDLSFNDIQTLENETFTNLASLKSLSLAHN